MYLELLDVRRLMLDEKVAPLVEAAKRYSSNVQRPTSNPTGVCHV
ncbi:hypothetical protein ACVBEJ_10190 [Porticoccus sp. GXU_MW_L64]